MPLQLKIETIAKEMYGAKSVEFEEKILNKLNTYESKVKYFKILQYTCRLLEGYLVLSLITKL